jgi:putative membrane protein
MLIQIIIFLTLGILFGTITGLIPGIHINLIGIFLITISANYISIEPTYFIVLITAMAITHTFVDFIPSTFLGCPDTDTELSILPAHDLLKRGEGYQAILLTAYGSITAIIILAVIALPSTLILESIYNLIRNYIPYLLILISLFLIFSEENKFQAVVVFTLSGILGFLVLSNNSLNQPLLPLLTGLFGGSNLILSLKTKTKIPEQVIKKPKIKKLRPIIGSLIASPLCSFFPGLGSGQAAILGNTIAKSDRRQFLYLIGITNTLVMGFSFISLYAISKTRTGAAVAIQEIIKIPSEKILILILIITIISGIISFFITILLAKLFAKNINKFNYTKISLATLLILILIIIFVTKLSGLAIFAIATLTGLYCISLKVRRTNMMGCLLIPVIIWSFL